MVYLPESKLRIFTPSISSLGGIPPQLTAYYKPHYPVTSLPYFDRDVILFPPSPFLPPLSSTPPLSIESACSKLTRKSFLKNAKSSAGVQRLAYCIRKRSWFR